MHEPNDTAEEAQMDAISRDNKVDYGDSAHAVVNIQGWGATSSGGAEPNALLIIVYPSQTRPMKIFPKFPVLPKAVPRLAYEQRCMVIESASNKTWNFQIQEDNLLETSSPSPQQPDKEQP